MRAAAATATLQATRFDWRSAAFGLQALCEVTRGRWRWPLALLVGLYCALVHDPLPASAQTAPPELRSHVTDGAGMLSPETARALEARLAGYARETGHQFAFVSIPSLKGDAIEDFSIRLAEASRLGDEKRDDGLILLVAKEDRKMRIEVGYGLEGAVTDALAAQIIRNRLRPAFKSGRFDEGVTEAFDLLMRAAAGESLRVGPPEQEAQRGFHPFELMRLLPIFLFFGLFAYGALRGGGSRRRRGRGVMFFGGFGGGGIGGGGGFSGGGFSGGGGGFGGGGASGGW